MGRRSYLWLNSVLKEVRRFLKVKEISDFFGLLNWDFLVWF